MPPARNWWNPGWNYKVWLMVAAMVLPTLGFATWVLIEAGGESPVDPELQALAALNAGAQVITITGTEHTSYHYPGPLPTRAAPREDGRLTLVWFTSPSCRPCSDMTFVHRVMAEYRGVAVSFEKSTDRDTSDERLGVEGAPAFLLLDVDGEPFARLSPDSLTEAEFRAWLTESGLDPG